MQLNRAKLADAVRSSPEFRGLTRQLERKTVRVAVRLADQRVKRRTGAFANNFETTVTPLNQTKNLVRLRLFNTRPYSGYIETGTGPHVIRATKPHGLLVFKVGGRTVFTRGPVQHPGTKPERIVRDALLHIASGRP